LCTASDDTTVGLWAYPEPKLLKTFHGHKNYVLCANFNPANSLIASASYDNTVRIWDVEKGVAIHTLSTHTDLVVSAHFNSFGTELVTAGFDGAVRVWNVSTGVIMRNFVISKPDVPVCFSKWSPNSKYIIVGIFDDTWKLINAKNGQIVRIYTGHTFNDYCIFGSFSMTDGRSFFSGSADHTVCMWDINTKQLLQKLEGHTDAVIAVAAHPTKNIIASGALDKDKTVRLWQPKEPGEEEDDNFEVEEIDSDQDNGDEEYQYDGDMQG
jgi:COMPASS component SWD3